jgi:hypothetical protein
MDHEPLHDRKNNHRRLLETVQQLQWSQAATTICLIYSTTRQVVRRPREFILFYATDCFMAEFAEAQSFYVIAIVIAIMYSNTQGVSFNGAANYISVILNQKMVFSIAFFASLPILITQFCLFRIRMDSIYSFLFSTTALVLANVTTTSL